MTNPNCDGGGPCAMNGEVRVLPTGGEGNAILCKLCYKREIAFRKARNRKSGNVPMDLPAWATLKVYGKTV